MACDLRSDTSTYVLYLC